MVLFMSNHMIGVSINLLCRYVPITTTSHIPDDYKAIERMYT